MSEGIVYDPDVTYPAAIFPANVQFVQATVCPSCGAVGTFNVHGPSGGAPWRCLCKYCGYYVGDGKQGRLCYPSKAKGCWAFLDRAEEFGDTETRTPKQLIEETLNKCWPWRM
jgi:hypothetical protein